MAKPDLQEVRIDPVTGDLRRLKGKLGLSQDTRFQNLIEAANDTAATSSGIPEGGLYRTGSAIKVRVS